MSIPDKYKGKYFYHFTHIDNLGSIIENDLLCTNMIIEKNLKYSRTTLSEIKGKNYSNIVPFKPFGTMNDYVHFYFSKRTHMLLSLVRSKNVDQYNLIYFAVSIELLNNENVIFTDVATENKKTVFFKDPKELDFLDWNAINAMTKIYKNDDQEYKGMAEGLIYEKLEISKISYIVTWDAIIGKRVREIFNEKNVKCPHISYLDNSHYFYTYFNKVKHSIITGPDELYAAYEKISNEIIESRKDYNGKSCRFKNIEDAISKIHEKFDIIPELEGIYKLKTYNKIHHETVSKHTKSVVNNIKTKTFFKNFESSDKNILILSAYLHDIGKGPKTRWKNGIQEVDHNHPVKSLNMLKRILIDDLQYLTNEEIKLLCLNIVYHDIIGEIVGKNRDINQLKKIIKKEKELDMIIELGCADMAAIKLGFFLFNKGKIANIRNDVMSNLN